MIRLGIDPGLAHVGLCVMAGNTPIHASVLRTKALARDKREAQGISKVADKMRRADEIGRYLHDVIETFRVTHVAHEQISLGFHQAMTLFDLGIAFGAISAVCAAMGVHREAVLPKAIKEWTRSRYAVSPPTVIEKEQVIVTVRAVFPSIVWPKAESIHEHLADAVVCATLCTGGEHAA